MTVFKIKKNQIKKKYKYVLYVRLHFKTIIIVLISSEIEIL